MAYSDSFTYSDGALPTVSSGAWANVDAGLTVVSNQVRGNVGGTFNIGYYVGTYANDQYAELKVVGGTADNDTSWVGPAVRIDTSTGACYAIEYFRNPSLSAWDYRIAYYGGSGVSAVSSVYSAGSGLTSTDVLRLEVTGSAPATLTAKINGTTILTWTDSSLASGKGGIAIYAWATNGDFLVDDWAAGDLGTAAPSITSVSSASYYNGQTGIVITGTGFGATHTGSADVFISPTNSISDATKVTQTQTAWADTSITFTAVRGSLPVNTSMYLFVKESGGSSNATGSAVQFILDPIRLRWTS